ncbi:unnamed protein product, partial [Meganyctiphanes norvegica]
SVNPKHQLLSIDLQPTLPSLPVVSTTRRYLPHTMTEIKYEELSLKLPEVTIVDMRKREEVEEQGMLPKSYCVPIQEFEEAMDLGSDAFSAKYGFPKPRTDDSNIVISCRSGRRVGLAMPILDARGYKQHRLYHGSFLDWVEKGGSITKPGVPFKPQQ